LDLSEEPLGGGEDRAAQTLATGRPRLERAGGALEPVKALDEVRAGAQLATAAAR